MNPEAIEKMIENGRDSYEARLAAGQARRKDGDARRAVEHLEHAVEFDETRSAAWLELGHARLGLDDRAGAREAWRRGLEAAERQGDVQAGKMIRVFLKRLDRDA
ncbi:MAG: hypothetical protein R3323_01640 [Wenzhouxiangellaceae bacterium]|nr:hypothetical protein [Wenzhouxiangellaceae bacterium]